MNSNKKMMMLFIKFTGLKRILNLLKEGYCDFNATKVSDFAYIHTGNCIKRLLQTADEIEKSFDDYLVFRSEDFDKDLAEKIGKNIQDKYQDMKGITFKLFEEFNVITLAIASLNGIETGVLEFNPQTQEEFVIV